MARKEIWKDIPGYEGIYLVSNLGRVKRLPLGKQWPYRMTHNNIRKPKVSNGYYVVNLSKNNKVKWFGVHRLVAMAFIPNPMDLPMVNHKNENKLDNQVDNLEWCDAKYNANYGDAREKQKISRALSDKSNNSRRIVGDKLSKRVALCDENGVVDVFKSITEAMKITGVDGGTIIGQCKGKRKSRRKTYWRYYDDVQ